MIAPRINIYDVDQTTITGQSEDIFDVAFIPGFATKHLDDIVSSASPSPLSGASITEPTGMPTNGHYWYDTTNAKQFKYSVTDGTIYEASQVSYNQCDGDGNFIGFNLGTHNVYEGTAASGYPVLSVGSTSSGSPSEGDHYYTMSGGTATLNTYTNGSWSSVSGFTVIGTGGMYLGYSKFCEFDSVSTYAFYELSNVTSGITATEQTTLYSSENRGYTYTSEQGVTTLFKDVQTDGWSYSFTQLDEYNAPVTDTITKFNSFSAFVNYVGDKPLTIWKHTIKGTPNTEEFSALDPYNFAATKVSPKTNAKIQEYIRESIVESEIIWTDRNWIYSAELLKLGLPVIYYTIAGMDKTQISTILSAAASQTDIDPIFRGMFIDYTGNDDGDSVFAKTYSSLSDRGEYDAKYLTVGAFGIDLTSDINLVRSSDPTEAEKFDFMFPFYDSTVTRKVAGFLADVADYRKNSLVLIDALQEQSRKSLLPSDSESVYYQFKELVKNDDFANPCKIMTPDEMARAGCKSENTFPWFYATCNTFPSSWAQYRDEKNVFVMPGSFGYLKSLATTIQKFGQISWQAIAGVTRALIPDFVGLYTDERLSNSVADAYNKRNDVGINAITNIRPYGYCIWGNRTFVNNEYFANLGDGSDGLIASSFVDIMSMVCNINTVAYRTCKRLMFEKDNDVLWTRFLQGVSPYLDQLTTGGGLRTYEITKEPSTMRGQLVAKITVWPIYATENFDIAIVLRDTEAAE